MSLVNSIVQQASQPLLDLCASGLVYLLIRGSQWLSAHTKNVQVQGMIARLDDAVTLSVRDVEQSVARSLKESTTNGKLDADSAAKAKAAAIDAIKLHLGGDKGLEQVKKILGVDDVAALLASRIEAAVHDLQAKKA